MAVKYVLTEKGNPAKPDDPKKYYAQAKSAGEVTFKKLSREIAEGSTTVSDTDVLAVLNDLTKLLNRHLSEGRIVRFGDFGSFQIGISGEGAESPEKFNVSLIKKGKVNFRPGVDIRQMLNNLRFEKEG
ncbi:MAG: DNA-binding domain-containing protein [Petrimonas sp.]|nr:DNA-binding domain-containing protein [Petrimonas sp.]